MPREERRRATVLFADLSGFTAMAEQMDPEDVRELVHRCAERSGEQVRRFGGTVINVMGDGVLAVFGAPVAHEDDAERAVRAALAMRDAPLSDDPARPIRLHIGLNTGDGFAGVVGPEERRDYTVTGDTVNTTDRLARAAGPGAILVGEETYRATRRVVAYREVPSVVARGKERPVRAWEALEVLALPAARPLGTAPLVGRDEELGLLAGIWRTVTRDARPHLVTVLGEPGMGKSRLVAEFEHHELGGARVIHGRCLPYGEVLGYATLAMALKEAAGITAEDSAEAARGRLGDLVAGALAPEGSAGDATDVARHLALLSGLDVAADRAARAVDQRTLHASVRLFLEALARRQPLCLMFEDLHWADAALLDLIEFVASRAQAAPLLILTQARPELLEKRPGWGRGVSAFTSLPLEPLSERAEQALIAALCDERRLTGGAALPLGSGSGGNPLFAEELVAMIAERAGSGRGAPREGIPSLIKSLISARLDALPPAERRTLQSAAVFGKLFWEGGLRALGAPGGAGEHLEALTQRSLLRAQPASQFRGEREYVFKHDLIRDVAYETLPRAERRVLHGRAADWIEQAGGGRIEESLDVLAHHALEAGQHERAISYLIRAAERARRASAHREEAALLGQAIDIAERLGRREAMAELQARRGRAFTSGAMWHQARPELSAALEGLGLEWPEQRAELLGDLSLACYWLFDVPGLRRCAAEALTLAEQVGRDDLAAGAMGMLTIADQSDGAVHDCLERYRAAFARAGQRRVPVLALPMEHSGLLLYWMGRLDESVERSRAAIQFAREANDTSTTLRALSNLALAFAARGQYAEALAMFEEAQQFGRERLQGCEYGIGMWLARCTAMQGGLHLEVGDFEGAEALAEEARAMGRSVGFPIAAMMTGVDLLLNFARRREVGRAEKLVDEVAADVQRAAGVHGWLGRIRFAQAQAELNLARGDDDAALRWAEETVAQSRVMGRVKYHVAGLAARAGALAASGRTREAIGDLRGAVERARQLGDPAICLRAATGLLAIDGDDALAAEARATADRIAAALPDGELRRRFETADPVRLLTRGTRDEG